MDGGIHGTSEQIEYDEGRTAELEEKGFKILGFKNDEVLNDINRVLEKISEI